jgi:diaminopimelate decarboxylase
MSAPSEANPIEQLQSLTAVQAGQAAAELGTPVYTYSEHLLRERARQALAFHAPFGLTVRYAMKANPLAAILRIFDAAGLHIDASSGLEAHRAMAAGIAADHIMITSQQLPDDLYELARLGVSFNATSLHQLETFGQMFPGGHLSVRINPGIGSGHSRKTSTGGPTSSFGIWHEDIPQIKKIAAAHQLTIAKLHTHIGAGTDPKVWHEAARITLELAEHFPDVLTVNLGGGFKIARMSTETPTNLAKVSLGVADLIKDFAKQTGRKLHLEIEPGTYLVANAGALVSRVIDITSTGADGYTFLKLDTGLTEIMRPSLYGAQHPVIVLNTVAGQPQPYVVVGHTCESGDLLTPEPTEPDVPATRLLAPATIGDLVVIEGVGAYCASMSAKGYNSFPEPAEAIITVSGKIQLAKRPATFSDQLARELQ